MECVQARVMCATRASRRHGMVAELPLQWIRRRLCAEGRTSGGRFSIVSVLSARLPGSLNGRNVNLWVVDLQ